jgi:hypothetical protein
MVSFWQPEQFRYWFQAAILMARGFLQSGGYGGSLCIFGMGVEGKYIKAACINVYRMHKKARGRISKPTFCFCCTHLSVNVDFVRVSYFNNSF